MKSVKRTESVVHQAILAFPGILAYSSPEKKENNYLDKDKAVDEAVSGQFILKMQYFCQDESQIEKIMKKFLNRINHVISKMSTCSCKSSD